MYDSISYLIGCNFFVVYLLIGLFVILRRKSRIGDINFTNGWFVFFTVMILSVADALETVCSWNPELRVYRVILSVIGYWLRPLVALGYLSLTVDFREHKNRIYFLPAIINFVVFITSFFTKWTFWFDDAYEFHRGPLGYVVFLVSYFYVLCILIHTIRTFKSGGRNQGVIMLVGALGVISASFFEAKGITSYVLNSSVLVAVLLYYLYVFSEVTARDPGTQLFNRQTFYEDLSVYESRITAVISIDMNGLKTINDTKGHKEGDEALSAIANAIKSVVGNVVFGYRIGGDEFFILCLGLSEGAVIDLIANLEVRVLANKLSVSTGYAMKTSDQSLNDVLDLADQRMYESKARYYKESGVNRRRT